MRAGSPGRGEEYIPGTAQPSLAAQPSLFDQRPIANRAPIAAAGDPATSHRAAQVLTVSGVRSARKKALLDFLRSCNEPLISFEIAVAMRIDRHVAAKRLPDCRRDRLVENCGERPCRLTGKPALTWRAVPPGGRH